MIPAFIINFNRLTLPRAIVDYLTPDTGCQPVIIDNGSTYPPLLDWYAGNPCKVHRLSANHGNCALWSPTCGVDFFADYDMSAGYVVTDPDLDLSRIPKDFLSVLRDGLRRRPGFLKCGFSLEIDDLPDNEIGDEARGWETINWTGLTDGYYQAPIDTTFAFYSGRESHDFDKCLRAPRPYTARHMPWYYTANNLPEDERYYLNSITAHYNHYSIRLRQMLDGPEAGKPLLRTGGAPP
jgi:hypothetical protein